MAYKERESTLDDRPKERRHRTKEEKEASRLRKEARAARPKAIDPETGEPVKIRRRKKGDKDSQASSSMADLIPELARTASAPGANSRSSLPYPTFNKTYSREAVNSKEDFRTPAKGNVDPYTPNPTDVSSADKLNSKSTENVTRRTSVTKSGRPPSPPETDVSQQRKATPSRVSRLQEEEQSELSRSSSRNSLSGRYKEDTATKSKVSAKSRNSNASTARMKPETNPIDTDLTHDTSIDSEDSNVTPVATRKSRSPTGPKPTNLDTSSSSESPEDSSPRTPTQIPGFQSTSAEEIKPSPSPFIHFDVQGVESSAFNSPQPPPPPPPPCVPINIPQVDYLLQNGGLPRTAPKSLLSAAPSYPSHGSARGAAPPMANEVERIFGPYFSVLDQYSTVLKNNGSLAVATGYRSVARRLLDRLENVFNRDLSSEGCFCVMCQNSDHATHEGSRGLGWGEVLEWVSGRREVPPWPAFDFATLGVKTNDDLAGLGISDHTGPVRPGSPIKMDPDIGEEFREHYLQQSKKTKVAVSKWLSSCPQTAATPPQEVDDETLSFAILTHLEYDDRPVFNALMSGSTVLQPATRAPTPFRKNRPDFMVKTVGSVQRLYRLPTPPRDPEVAIYLLKNPHIHNLLATMSGINTSEWEILISGRFDGFLWSGNESEAPSPAVSRGPTPANGMPSRGPMSPAFRQPSRNNTPFSPARGQTFSPAFGGANGLPSRGPTPSYYTRHPVSNDEETEIAVLAELEREVYVAMEFMEDAFEALHRKAETVRREFRERAAGLTMSLQSRRTSYPDIISGTPGPPSGGMGPGYERPSWAEGGSEVASDSDWDVDNENQSELAPDDSASNISTSRHRRPKRRYERRTPALVEEDEED